MSAENALADKLTELLSDPAGMEKIREMASSLLGDVGNKPDAPGEDAMPDPAALMQMVKALGDKGPDPRADLLIALKPHLSAERRPRVDRAVKLLRLASLLPAVKEYL